MIFPAPEIYPSWQLWANELLKVLNVDEELVPVRLARYAKAKLPPAKSYTACFIYVVDDASGATPAYSDGVDWRRTDTGAVVS